MKKLAVILITVLLLAGCASASIRGLDSVPGGAELVYSHETGFATGFFHSYGTWAATSDAGYFVVEIRHNQGSLQGVKVVGNTAAGNTTEVAALGNISGDAILATEPLEIQDGTYNYSLSIAKIEDFDGAIHVYFVAD